MLLATLVLEDALAGSALDPTKPLDIDVDELARPRALVTDRLLEPDPAQPSHAPAREHRGNGRGRHRQCLRDLRGRKTQAAQSHDHVDSFRRSAISDPPRRRRTIVKA